MKHVWMAALLVACGGGKPKDNGEIVIPADIQKNADTAPKSDDKQAVVAEGFNEEGKKAMFAGNYALASEHFRNAVARMPEPKYFFNLCTSLFQEGKFAEAKTACAAVDAGQPTPELAEKAHALTARIDAEAKQQGIPMKPAEHDTTPTPKATGGQAAIAAKLSDEGVQLMYAQKYAEASSKFREAVARVPEPKYFFNLCTSLYQEGKFSEALTACGAVEKNNPTPALQAKTDKMTAKIKDEAKAQGVQVSPY